MIARALASEARLLLLDEPTAGLDPTMGFALYEHLAELRESMTVVIVSHDIGVIMPHVTSVACLNRRLHYHPSREITAEMIEATYGCSVDFLVHEHGHRNLAEHAHSQPQPYARGSRG